MGLPRGPALSSIGEAVDDVPYRWFDHTADLGMEVAGDSLEALFANAARGLYELAGAPFETDRPVEEEIRLRGADVPELMVSWLSELLFRLGSRGRWYRTLEIEVHGAALRARASGGLVPEGARRMEREIKAVTRHGLEVEQRADGRWRARLVFDV